MEVNFFFFSFLQFNFVASFLIVVVVSFSVVLKCFVVASFVVASLVIVEGVVFNEQIREQAFATFHQVSSTIYRYTISFNLNSFKLSCVVTISSFSVLILRCSMSKQEMRH